MKAIKLSLKVLKKLAPAKNVKKQITKAAKVLGYNVVFASWFSPGQPDKLIIEINKSRKS